jgi:hypothetical protein
MADVYKWYPVDFSGEGSWFDFAFEKTKADAMLRVGIIKREHPRFAIWVTKSRATLKPYVIRVR